MDKKAQRGESNATAQFSIITFLYFTTLMLHICCLLALFTRWVWAAKVERFGGCMRFRTYELAGFVDSVSEAAQYSVFVR